MADELREQLKPVVEPVLAAAHFYGATAEQRDRLIDAILAAVTDQILTLPGPSAVRSDTPCSYQQAQNDMLRALRRRTD